jgi:hypothetical protein
MNTETPSVPVLIENVVHHGGTIRSNVPLTVETSPRQWDYAVSVRLVLATHAPQLRLPVQVSVAVSVESVTLSRALPDPFDYSPRITSVIDKDERRIDISKLAHAAARPELYGPSDKEVLDLLRRKWSTVPAGLAGRRGTSDLKDAPDDELRDLWLTAHREATTGEGFEVRGSYQALYRDLLRGQKVLEIGSGMGLDGIEFARHGARMTLHRTRMPHEPRTAM